MPIAGDIAGPGELVGANIDAGTDEAGLAIHVRFAWGRAVRGVAGVEAGGVGQQVHVAGVVIGRGPDAVGAGRGRHGKSRIDRDVAVGAGGIGHAGVVVGGVPVDAAVPDRRCASGVVDPGGVQRDDRVGDRRGGGVSSRSRRRSGGAVAGDGVVGDRRGGGVVAVDPAAVGGAVAGDGVVGDRRGGGVAVDPAAVEEALLPVMVLLVIVGEEE